MLENIVAPSRGLSTLRGMVDGFDGASGGCLALTMRKSPGRYWELTYRELKEHIRRGAAALAAMGIGKGDRVGVISENRSEWVITYLSTVYLGAVIVPFDILLKPDELALVVKASGPRIVFTSSEYAEKVLKAEAAAGEKKSFVLFDDADPRLASSAARLNASAAEEARRAASGTPAFGGERFLPFAAFLALGGAALEGGQDPGRFPVEPDDLAALIFTSGTTGAPKGVMLSHRNLVDNADGTQRSTKLGPGDNWIVVLPFHHTYPTMMGILVPLLTFGRITCVPSMKTNVLIEIMKDTGATCVPAMPLLIEKIYKGILAKVGQKPPLVRALFRVLLAVSSFFYKAFKIRLGKLLFKSVARELGVSKLRFFISGGGPIAKEIIDGMEALGLATYNGYGLTETSPVVASACPTRNRPGSVGLPLPNVEVRIDAPDGNGNGEILVRGSAVMRGYYNMPEKTREVIDADGWFHTGDIGMMDTDGYVFITGRLKNVIVTKGGKNIYPEEIENLLLQSPLIAEAVIIGKLDKDGGEYPHAVIHPNADAMKALETQENRLFTEEDVRKTIKAEIQRCTSGAAVYKIPQGFEISKEELPKTSSNKVKRFLFAEKNR
jgi:long-chain acyl-CoA synthetase